MNTNKCIACFNDKIISFAEIKPCQHSICYGCIAGKLITKSILTHLERNAKMFIFKCPKCSNSSISLSYEQINSILSITAKVGPKSNSSNGKEAYCALHKAKYDYYCKSCKLSICKECISNDHKYHQWIMIKEYKQKLSQASSKWLNRSFKDIEMSLKKNAEFVTKSLNENYNLLNAEINKAIDELKLYLTQMLKEREGKLQEVKYFSEIIKQIYRKHYSDLEEIDFKDISEVRYLSKIKYEYCKMSYKPFKLLPFKNENIKASGDIVYFPKLKPPSINYCFIKHKKVSITFSSKIRPIKECLNIINTKTQVCEVLLMNENEIYFSSGSLMSDSKDKNIQIYNIKGRKFDKIETHHANSVLCLCEINNNRIASGSYDNSIKLWNLLNYKEEGSLIGHKGPITGLLLLKTDMLVSGSKDSYIKIWDLLSMACASNYSDNSNEVYCLCLVNHMIYSGGQENDIKILSVNAKSDESKQGISINQIGILKGHSDIISTICINKGRTQIASGSKDATIRIWKKSKGSCIGVLSGHNSYITDLTYLIDNRLASSSKDKTIRIWNMNNMSCDIVLQAQEGPILALSLLYDGRLLSGFKNNMIRIWG